VIDLSQKKHFSVVIVGGGQAGLSVSYYLGQKGVDHMVFEKETMAHKWSSQRWDSFCLVTPNWQCKLPDFPYPGEDPHGFMVKDEIIDYVNAFIEKVKPPVVEHCGVETIQKTTVGFVVETEQGTVIADTVVLATSLYGTPSIPRPAEKLPSSVVQLHSADYRKPDQLPEGAVMVVGSGQSGSQIAEDLHLAGRKVHLATGDAPRCARFYRGRDVTDWLWDMGHYEITVTHDGMGGKKDDTNHYLTGRDGGRDIDLRAFALQGMALYGRMTDVVDGVMMFKPNLKANLDKADQVYNGINGMIDGYIARSGIKAPRGGGYQPVWEPEGEPTCLDLAAEGISSVIWATGFRPNWSYADLPIFNGAGYPVHERGVTPVPGAFVVGLPWLWTWGSGRFLGIAEDAAFIAERVIESLEAERKSLARAG
jgi:putative flavoprotein involved in K+ transport